MNAPGAPTELKRVLGPVHLWAIAVGLVISGDYFGWNYGLGKGGPVGMALATLLVTLMYVCFIFSYTELGAAIPHAGGPFAFSQRALGDKLGFVAGICTLIEFLCAPPAIARAIGAYVHFRVPELSVNSVALSAFVVFCAVNALGVTLAVTFELVITAAAAFELFLFFFLTAPQVSAARLFAEPLLPFGALGVFAAIPFAIWFYLGMEGVAMSAEEVKDPKRAIPKGYIAGIVTLVVLALGTLICTSGVLPWQELIVDDSPLPKTLAAVLDRDHPMTHLMVYLGLFGLIASFHGIIMGASRQVFALAREGFLPRRIGALHPRFKTPIWAVVASGVIGAALVLTERTDDLISLSAFGAVGVYILSMISVVALRKKEPALERPFVAPFYPVFPLLALGIAVVCLVAMIYGSPWYVSLGFFSLLGAAFVIWTAVGRSR
ncbi:MAG: ethanolamine permease [Deltaproteobacteria bacterium]|nr:ethanolamine permease [Deltaproteobacteria bacterium]